MPLTYKYRSMTKRHFLLFMEEIWKYHNQTLGDNPESWLGQIFNFKLGRFATKRSKGLLSMQPLLELKTCPRVSQVCSSLLILKCFE